MRGDVWIVLSEEGAKEGLGSWSRVVIAPVLSRWLLVLLWLIMLLLLVVVLLWLVQWLNIEIVAA